MIVSCENCHTRFKLDNERLRAAGVKLRCSKCQHTFELKPFEPGASTPGEETPAAAPPATATPVPGEAPNDETAPTANDGGPTEEVVLGAGPGGMPGPRFDPDEIDRAVDAALRQPDGPATGDMNQAEGSERSARVEDLFGAPDSVDENGPPPDSPSLLAPAPGNPRERSEDFDWDHLSFTESRPPSAEDALKASEEVEKPSETEPLELDTDRPQIQTGRAGSQKVVRDKFPEPATDAGSELELERPVPSASWRSQGSGSPAFSRPPDGAGRSRGLENESRGKRPEAPAPRAKTSVVLTGAALSLASPIAARPKRPPLVLPLFPAIIGLILLGLVVAVVSALTIYAPDRSPVREPAVVKPAGAPRDPAALRLDDLSGRRIGREDSAPLYLVTGKARWSAPPKGRWVLDGVLVDRSGHALQRRRAWVGPLASLARLSQGDPGPDARGTPLPGKGQSGFQILFSPHPSWQADVRFEVRRAD